MCSIICRVGVALALSSLACGTSTKQNVDGAAAVSNRDAAGSGDVFGGTPCERACAAYQNACGGNGDCTSNCSVVESPGVGEAAVCPKESQAFFDCVAVQPLSAFDCATIGDTMSMLLGAKPPVACSDSRAAYQACVSTNGQDCLAEPALDESCAILYPATPHYTICKVDVTPAAGCVPYDMTLPKGWYCCP